MLQGHKCRCAWEAPGCHQDQLHSEADQAGFHAEHQLLDFLLAFVYSGKQQYFTERLGDFLELGLDLNFTNNTDKFDSPPALARHNQPYSIADA